MKVVQDIRRENLNALIKKYGSIANLNEAVGRKRTSPAFAMIRAKAGSGKVPRDMGSRIARELEKRLGLPVGYMDADHSGDEGANNARVISLHYLDVQACCGNAGRINYLTDSTVMRIDVDESWFTQNVSKARRDGFEIITAYGDSMNPTFNNGDCLIVDTKRNAITSDGIYCLAIDDELYIKRVQRVPGGFILIADNPRYRPTELTGPILERVNVIGQIVTSLNINKYV